MPMPSTKSPAFFVTVMPCAVTSAGRRACTVWIAFCTSVAARSRLRSRSKVHVIVLVPLLLDCDEM